MLEGGVEHRLQMSEVRRVDSDLRGENDLLLVHTGLRVVGLAGRRAHLQRRSPGWARNDGSLVTDLEKVHCARDRGNGFRCTWDTARHGSYRRKCA